MPRISEHKNCWIKFREEQERYGPVTCTLEINPGNPFPQAKHGWGGTLIYHPGAKQIPICKEEDEIILVLEDGRWGHIFLGSRRTKYGRRSNGSIDFHGQGQLKSDEAT